MIKTEDVTEGFYIAKKMKSIFGKPLRWQPEEVVTHWGDLCVWDYVTKTPFSLRDFTFHSRIAMPDEAMPDEGGE